jgi:hypothetical protein
MEVDLSGSSRVLDEQANLDAPWQPLTRDQIASCLWRLVRSRANAAGGHSEELQQAA